MTYTEAQAEFCIRLYRWAKIAQEKEMREGFPQFRLSNRWSHFRCLFFQNLNEDSQILFGQGLLQMRHQLAVKALGEVISADAQALIRQEEAFRSQNAWTAAPSSDASLDKRALATRRQIKKAIATHFRSAFGQDQFPVDRIPGGTSVRYEMVCRGWTVRTEFEFGRWDPEITCEHDIWTGKLITKDEPQVLFANCLGFQLNYGNEIGIGSGWEGITVEDIEPTCLTVVEHCRRMFDVFPVLLENLDLSLLAT